MDWETSEVHNPRYFSSVSGGVERDMVVMTDRNLYRNVEGGSCCQVEEGCT